MKAKVRYYDFDTDGIVEKICYDFHYTSTDIFRFEFMPVDDPVRIYRNVIIVHPKITIHYSKECNGLVLSVEGFQNTRKYGYSLFTTTITIKEDEKE